MNDTFVSWWMGLAFAYACVGMYFTVRAAQCAEEADVGFAFFLTGVIIGLPLAVWTGLEMAWDWAGRVGPFARSGGVVGSGTDGKTDGRR